jgi:hypothetical protein
MTTDSPGDWCDPAAVPRVSSGAFGGYTQRVSLKWATSKASRG